MSRLTRRAENGTAVYATPSGEPVKWENNRRKVLQKLADYEDLEEQGLLLKLPCKVGDIIYYIEDNCICEIVIKRITIMKDKEGLFFRINYTVDYELSDFGKTVFLTKEEAVKELERLERENDIR